MIRALARETGSAVGAGQFVSAPSYEERIGSPRAGRAGAGVEAHDPRPPLLQPRRRHQPRRRARQLLPVHPDRRVRRRGDRPEARRAAPAHARALAPVAHPRRASSSRSRRSTATPSTSPPPASAWRTAPPSSPTSCASRSSTTAPRRARSRSRASSPAAPAPRSPGWSSACSATSATRSRSPGRRRSAHLERAVGRAPDPVLRPGAGAVAMRPVNLIPPEDRRGDRAPLRAGSLSYVVVGACRGGAGRRRSRWS